MPRIWRHVPAILLIFGAQFYITATQSCSKGISKCSPISLVNSAVKSVTCSDTNCDKAADGNTNSRYMTTQTSSPFVEITLIGKFGFDKLFLKQLDASYRQIKTIDITMGSTVLSAVFLSVQGDDWQHIKFSSVIGDKVRIDIKTFYSSDATVAFGFQDIAILNEDCLRDLHCKTALLEEGKSNPVLYDVNSNSIAIEMDPKNFSGTMKFTFLPIHPKSSGIKWITAYVQVSPTAFTMTLEDDIGMGEPTTVSITTATSYTFWADFSDASTFYFGCGLDFIVSKAFSIGQDISVVEVDRGSITPVKVTICEKRKKCLLEPDHHWPLELKMKGYLLDVQGHKDAQSHGTTVLYTFSSFTSTIHNIGGGSKHEHINFGDFSATQMFNPGYWSRGWTLSFSFQLLKNNSASSVATGEVISLPGRLSVAFTESDSVTMVIRVLKPSVEVLFEALISGIIYHRRYDITITWSQNDELYVYRDINSKIQGHPTTIEPAPRTSNDLHFGCSPERAQLCPNFYLSGVKYWNVGLSSEEVLDSYQCYPNAYHFGNPSSGVSFSRSKLSASSHDKAHSSNGARAWAIGSFWRPGMGDSNPFLQVDLEMVMKVYGVGVQGDVIGQSYVDSFALSYKKAVSPWDYIYYVETTVPAEVYPVYKHKSSITSKAYTADDGTKTVLTGAINANDLTMNNLPSDIETCSLRFYPISWVGEISMKVEVFVRRVANYVGCFRKSSQSFIGLYDADNMTPELCLKTCASYFMQYALLRGGHNCFCGAVVPTNPAGITISDDVCAKSCSGNPSLACGSQNHDAVYEVKGTYTSPSFVLTVPIDMLTIFTEFSISYSALPENDYHIALNGSVPLRTSETTMNLMVPSPGIHTIEVWSTTGDYGEPHFVQEWGNIMVQMEPSISFECPPAVEAGEVFQCFLSAIQSPNIDITVDLKDGNVPSIQSFYETYQAVIGDDFIPDESVDDDGVYVLPYDVIPNEGVLQGIEVMATKVGILKILISRPYCNFNASEAYVKADGTSTMVSECSFPSVQLPDMFCMKTGAVSASYCHDRPVGLASSSEIYFEYIAFVHTGLNYLSFESNQLDDAPRFRHGDQIAFAIPPDVGASLAAYDTGMVGRWLFFADHHGDVGTMLDMMSGQPSQKLHYIKAYYSLSTTMVFDQTYANVGIYEATASYSSEVIVSSIIVSEAIVGGNWTLSHDMYIATNATLSYTIEALTKGHNVTVTISFDEDNFLTTTHDYVTKPIGGEHTYTIRGLQPLTLTYINSLSVVEYSCSLHVQDTVEYLEWFQAVLPVATGNETEMSWYVLQGSDVWFLVDLGDGTVYNNGTFDVDSILAGFTAHTYEAPGEYPVNITLYNNVSSVSLFGLAVVEDPIVNLHVDVVHANRDIEVLEVITFEISMDNGTNTCYSIDLGDGRVEQGCGLVIDVSYTTWDIYEVNVTVWNNVSRVEYHLNVTVHKPVEPLIGFVVTAPATNLTDPSPFMLDIENGTDYNCTWDFADGTMGTNDYDDLGTMLYHLYTDIGVYPVFVNCTNRLYAINFTFIAIVQVPITQFIFNCPQPIFTTAPLIIEFDTVGTNDTYNVTIIERAGVSDPLVWHNDDLMFQDETSVLGMVLPLPEHAVGYYDIEAIVWNEVTAPQTITCEVPVDKPITKFGFNIEKDFWEVNTTVSILTIMDLGTRVVTTVQWGDGTSDVYDMPEEFPSTSGFTLDHVYLTDGTFTVFVVLSNSVSETNFTIELDLQFPPDLLLTSNSPQIFPGNDVHFVVEVRPGKEPPTDALATWYFGDGSSLGPKLFSYAESHTYTAPGWYIVTVSVENEVGVVNFTGFGDVQVVIVDPVVTTVNTGGDHGDGSPGRGPNGNIHPLEYPVRFIHTISNGTNVTYNYDYGDGIYASTNLTDIEHLFTTSGVHTVNIIVNNSVSSQLVTIQVIIQESVSDIQLLCAGPTVFFTPFDFHINIEKLGYHSCIYAELANDTRVTFRHESTPACHNPGFSDDIRTFSGKVLNFSHIYKLKRENFVTIEGANFVSSFIVKGRAVVVDEVCEFPRAIVVECGKNATTARKFIKSEFFIIPTENKINCRAALYSFFNWTVRVYKPNEAPILDAENQTTQFHGLTNMTGIHYNSSRLQISPRALDYGIYECEENITMIGVQGVWDVDKCYFEVIKSPLKVVIHGGSERSVGHGKNVTFDASSSGDPDVEEGDRTDIEVYWLCMAQSDAFTFPGDPMNMTRLPITPLNTSADAIDVGCFGHGPGLLDYSDYEFTFATSHMRIGEKYLLRLFLRKAERTAFVDTSIVIMAGDPPALELKCEINCVEKLNPSEKITYGVDCTSCTEETASQMLYEWDLSVADPSNRVTRSVGDHNDFMPVELASKTRGPIDRSNVVIDSDTLEGNYEYKLQVRGWLPGGSKGFGVVKKFVNAPPHDGSCSVSPAEGVVLQTGFTVTCEGWDDPDLPLIYQIMAPSAGGTLSILYEGGDAVRTGLLLPLGEPYDEYRVPITVNIKDVYGATVTTTMSAKVTNGNGEVDVDALTSDAGILGNLAAEGNVFALATFALSFATATSPKADVIVTPAPIIEDADTKEIERPLSPAEQEEMERQKELEEQRKREKEVKLMLAREKLLDVMAAQAIDPADTTMAVTLASTVAAVTDQEMTSNSLATATQFTSTLTKNLLHTKTTSELKSLSKTIATIVGNVVGAPNQTDAELRNSKDLYEKATETMFESAASAVIEGEEPFVITTDKLTVVAQIASPAEIAEKGIDCGGGGFGVPDLSDGSNNSAPLTAKAVSSVDNAFRFGGGADNVATPTMQLEFRNKSGGALSVSNLTEPVVIHAKTGQPCGNHSNVLLTWKAMSFYNMVIPKNDTSLHFEVIPEDPDDVIVALLKRGKRPTVDDYDYMLRIPDEPQEDTKYPKSPYMFFISNEDTNRNSSGVWYLALLFNDSLNCDHTGKDKDKPVCGERVANISMLMFSSGCQYWNDVNETWSGEGLVVGPQTSMCMVQCFSTHLTTFGGDFFVMPNAIDWNAISLDNLLSNPTVFAVVMAIFGIYVIGMIWARKRDKKDYEQIGATPLPDNDPRDTYLYELIFFTGHSPGAGTTSDVFGVLEGSNDETPPRRFKDEVRTKFRKSGVDTFILAVPSSLGRLRQLRIWHDNSGESPGWFLERVLVQDLQTSKKVWFLCDKWMAVEEEDGEVQRNLVPATKEDLTSFNLLFSTEARKSLTDSHLWFSVVKRPPRSTFTRCQRLTCCLTIILTTMLANAMFFQTDSTSSTGTEIRLGPIAFSVKQLSIAITSSMVVLPANLLIVTLFRKAGPKPPKKPKKTKDKKFDELVEENEDEFKDESIKEEEVIEMEEADENAEKQKAAKKKGKLPHWVVYVAYGVAFLACLVSATFTVFYGLTFGVSKSQKWIMTMMISFWQDVLISQPLKVFAAATFFALVIKNPDKVNEGEEDPKKEGSEIKPDEEALHKKDEDEEAAIKRLAYMPKPPDPVKLEEMRRFKSKQKLMYKIIREILSYLIFVCILLTVAYGNRDYRSHQLNNALSSYFIGGTYAGRMSLDQISDITDFYKYLKGSLLPTLKPDFWYGPYEETVHKLVTADNKRWYAVASQGWNDTTVYHQVHPYPRGYTADRSNAWLVGTPRVRQLRVKSENCVFPKGVDHLVGRCSKPYSFSNEDEGYYEEAWKPMNKSKIEKIKDDKWFKSPWSYKTGWQLKGTPYWGFFNTYWSGGFVAELSSSYDKAINQTLELEKSGWLDGNTRAVFFEFTIYNAFTNFFAAANILVEILPTGGYYPYPFISTTRLYRYVGAEAKVIMVLELIFFAYLMYYIVREVKELRVVGKRVYFRDPWNYFDILVIAFCIVSIVFYFMRMAATQIVINQHLDDKFAFVNFNYVMALDALVTSFMALSVFFSFLKFLRLLRFNSRIGMLATTIKACLKPLASFFILFLVVFLAYTQFAFLTFGQDLFDYSSFDQCIANMMGMTLGAFDFDALVSTNRILGPIFFFSFIMFMVMVLMNVFLSIINDTFNEVNADPSLHQNADSELADFMFERLIATVKRSGNNIEPIYKEPKDELGQRLDKVEDLSDKVQLVMRNMCLESIRHTSWFKCDDKEETTKKVYMIGLLMMSGEDFTETEICDAIPMMNTTLAKYNSDDLRKMICRYQEKLKREDNELEEVPFENDDSHDVNSDDDSIVDVNDDDVSQSGDSEQDN